MWAATRTNDVGKRTVEEKTGEQIQVESLKNVASEIN